MKLLIAVLLASLVATPAGAIEYSTVQAEKSRITFVSRQMGVAVNGGFSKFTAQVAFDPARPGAGKVNISIDLAGIDAGSGDANDEVVGKDWFNVRLFPTATFTSAGIKGLGGNKYQVTGPLTIKNKSLTLTAPFTFKADGGNGIFEGSFVVKRIDFAIGEGPWTDLSMIANDVQVNFHVVAVTSATPAPARLK